MLWQIPALGFVWLLLYASNLCQDAFPSSTWPDYFEKACFLGTLVIWGQAVLSFFWLCITFNGVDRLVANLAVWLFEMSVMILGPPLKHLLASCVAFYLAARSTITNLAIVDCPQCRKCELPGAWPVCVGHQTEQAASFAVLQDPLGGTDAGRDGLLESDCNDGEKKVDEPKAVFKRHGPYGIPDNWDDSDSDDAQEDDKCMESRPDPTPSSKCGDGEKKDEETKSASAPRRRGWFGMPENWDDSDSDDAQDADKGSDSKPDPTLSSKCNDGEKKDEETKSTPAPKRSGWFGMPENWDDSDSDDAQEDDKCMESRPDPTPSSKCGDGEKKNEETKRAPAPRRRNRFGMPEDWKGYCDSESDDEQEEDKGIQSKPNQARRFGLPDKGEVESEKKKEIPKPKARVVNPSRTEGDLRNVLFIGKMNRALGADVNRDKGLAGSRTDQRASSAETLGTTKGMLSPVELNLTASTPTSSDTPVGSLPAPPTVTTASPSVATPSATVATPSATVATLSATVATLPATVATLSATVATPSATVATSLPTIATPPAAFATASPTVASSTPTVTTASPVMVPSSSTVVTSPSSFATAPPTVASSPPNVATSSPTVTSSSPNVFRKCNARHPRSKRVGHQRRACAIKSTPLSRRKPSLLYAPTRSFF
ncbi:hypothetical protein NliqN6_6291, partial [Naganishia liquefaciens]